MRFSEVRESASNNVNVAVATDMRHIVVKHMVTRGGCTVNKLGLCTHKLHDWRSAREREREGER